MIKLKIDVMKELKKAGYSSYRLAKEGKINSKTAQSLRHGKISTTKTLNIICQCIGCKIEDVIEYVPDEK